MPRVSVIIPCYNLGQYIDAAVDSVLAQSFQDFEIIIVNDGSTDELTNNLLHNYIKPMTRIITTENQGLPAARNNGIKISSGEYICCLDADDKYHPDFLKKTSQILDSDKEKKIGFVTTYVKVFGNTNEIWKCDDYNLAKIVIENMIHVASLFRIECWKKVGGYVTNLSGYHDWNFWLSIAAKGYQWKVIKEVLFYYRDREGSMLKSSNQRRLEIKKIINQNNISFIKDNVIDILYEYDKQVARKVEYYNELTNAYKKLKNIRNSKTYQLASIFRDASSDWKMLLLFPLRILWLFLSTRQKSNFKKLVRSVYNN